MKRQLYTIDSIMVRFKRNCSEKNTNTEKRSDDDEGDGDEENERKNGMRKKLEIPPIHLH